jgi:membrane protein DedA with SNARE-associated domain
VIAADPIGAALLMAAPLGLLGLFVLMLVERLAPLLPSAGLLTAVGVAAADGWWCLPLAIGVSILGSAAGALAAYRAGSIARRLRPPALRRALLRRDRIGGWLRAARRGGAALPFTAQLVPATRIAAPFVAAIVPHDRRRFLVATAAGLTVWNMAFIALGYGVVRLGGSINATIVGLVLPLLAAGASLILAHRRGQASRRYRGLGD